MPQPPDTTPKGGGSFMKKKILGIPAPVAILVVAVAGYLVYKHYKSSSGSNTSGTSASTSVDPNAIDPTTGLTYGAEQQAGLNALGGPSTNGSGVGGVGGGAPGLSVGDLEGLLSSVQGLAGTTNYYYGGGAAGAAPTPTNTSAGNGGFTGFSSTPSNRIGTPFILATPNYAATPHYTTAPPPSTPNPSASATGPNPSGQYAAAPPFPGLTLAEQIPSQSVTEVVSSQGTPLAAVVTPPPAVQVERITSPGPATTKPPGGYSSAKGRGIYATH